MTTSQEIKEVYNGEIQKKCQMINRSISTKNGFRNVSRKEFLENCGKEITINLHDIMTSEEFYRADHDIKIKYLQTIANDFPGIYFSVIAKEMGLQQNIIRNLWKDANLPINNNQGVTAAARKSNNAFREAYRNRVNRHTDYSKLNIEFQCDANDLMRIINKFGINGNIRVKIEVLD